MKMVSTALIVTYAFNLYAYSSAEQQNIVESLDKHVCYLRSLAGDIRSIPTMMVRTAGDEEFNFLCQELAAYKHPAVLQCIIDIKRQRSLRPFFVMWDRFKSGHGNDIDRQDDELFLKECGSLLFTFYNNIFHEVVKDEDRARVTITEIIELYEAINALPLAKLLDLLDQMLDELTKILDEYKMKPDQTLFGWLSQNWWVPPVIIGTILINVLSL